MEFVPSKVFLTRGAGKSGDRLTSFELALRDAEIARFNLVSVSSILPPEAEIISKEEGLKRMSPGRIAYAVMARLSTNKPDRILSASVGCAAPEDPKSYGYLSEYHAFGKKEKDAGKYSENLAASMLASSMGLEFDSKKEWKEREEYFKISGKIVKTRNITQSAVSDKNGKWTSVIAAAVML